MGRRFEFAGSRWPAVMRTLTRASVIARFWAIMPCDAMRKDYQRAPRRPQHRPAILWWLLPYLLLALLGGGAHNHDFSLSPTFSSVSIIVLPADSKAFAWPSESRVSPPHLHFDSRGECLSCLWASSALGLLVAPLLFCALGSFAFFRISTVFSGGICARGLCWIRGPPLLQNLL